MAERQARYSTDHVVHLSEAQKWLDRQRSECRVEPHQLQMFVRLAGTGHVSHVVEAESVNLCETDEECLAVFLRELTSLIFEGPGDDQQVVLDHGGLVEYGDVGLGNWRDEEVGIVWKKRIDLRSSGFGYLSHGGGFQDPHLERDAVLLNHFHGGRQEVSGAALAGVGRTCQQRGRQRAWCQV